MTKKVIGGEVKAQPLNDNFNDTETQIQEINDKLGSVDILQEAEQISDDLKGYLPVAEEVSDDLGQYNLITDESPQETIDGVNKTFTTINKPIQGTSVTITADSVDILDNGDGTLSDGGTVDYINGTYTLFNAPTTSVLTDYAHVYTGAIKQGYDIDVTLNTTIDEANVVNTDLNGNIVDGENKIQEMDTLITNTKYIGEHNELTQYYANNITSRNGYSYIALQDNLGNLPPNPPITSNQYWGMVSAKGDNGADLVYRGLYDSNATYIVNDLVREGTVLYNCILQSTGNTPSSSPAYWAIFLEGGGDMNKSQYDTNTDGIVDYADLAYGLIEDSTQRTVTDSQISIWDGKASQSSVDTNTSNIATNTTNIATNTTQMADLAKYKTVTGTADAITVDTEGTFDLTVDGKELKITPILTNTGAATIAVDEQTAKAIKKFDIGTDAYIDLEAEDIKKNQQITLRWDLTNDFFVLAPKGGASPIKNWVNSTLQSTPLYNNVNSATSRLLVNGSGWVVCVTGLNQIKLYIDGVIKIGDATHTHPNTLGLLMYRFESSFELYEDGSGSVGVLYMMGDEFEKATPMFWSNSATSSTTLRKSVTGKGWIYGLNSIDAYVNLVVDGVTIINDYKVGRTPLGMLIPFNTGFTYSNNSNYSLLTYVLE